MAKKVIFTKHAAERLFERQLPFAEIRKMLEKGVRIEDKESGATICVYKSKKAYYTLVIDEAPDQVAIITAYESGKWQIEQYHKVKKHERSKVR